MHQKAKKYYQLASFTIQELLVVLVIIGILILLALPSLMPLISKTRSLEAKQALKHIYTLQKTYFYENSRYSSEIVALGYEQETLVTESESGKANYKMEIIEASPSSFLARATAVVDFDGDGEYNVWEINQNSELREIIKD
ncbi:general secretion pathway protein GspG [Cytophagales bacterium LB-30]|uniref:General secretion pathway protein GspG n=1 Tax=Shiella aurantiaca TaxID=3058365 RepID=A0ABT8F670_9BACT|nr:general secretion pathway protein GspG [Shiella aurantiaca]